MKNLVPDNLLYSNKHIWAKVEDEEVTMGITQYAAKLLCDDPPPGTHDITLISIDELEMKDKAEPFGLCKNETKGMDLINPLTYNLIERNFEAMENPAIVKQDPYGAGWLVKAVMENPEELEEMFQPDQYTEYTATNIPNGLYYSRNHIWVKEEGGNEVLIGLSDYGVKLLCLYPAVASINLIQLFQESIERDFPFGITGSKLCTMEMISPLTHKFLDENPEVIENPAIVSQKPYDNGWLIRVKMINPVELGELYTPEQYREYLGS